MERKTRRPCGAGGPDSEILLGLDQTGRERGSSEVGLLGWISPRPRRDQQDRLRCSFSAPFPLPQKHHLLRRSPPAARHLLTAARAQTARALISCHSIHSHPVPLQAVGLSLYSPPLTGTEGSIGCGDCEGGGAAQRCRISGPPRNGRGGSSSRTIW
jgi:hypothetical protein